MAFVFLACSFIVSVGAHDTVEMVQTKISGSYHDRDAHPVKDDIDVDEADAEDRAFMPAYFTPSEVMGMHFDRSTGEITRVSHGGQAEANGVQPGMKMWTVGGKPFSEEVFKIARNGEANFGVVFEHAQAGRPAELHRQDQPSSEDYPDDTEEAEMVRKGLRSPNVAADDEDHSDDPLEEEEGDVVAELRRQDGAGDDEVQDEDEEWDELRLDDRTDNLYTKAVFEEVYGGTAEWDAAPTVSGVDEDEDEEDEQQEDGEDDEDVAEQIRIFQEKGYLKAFDSLEDHSDDPVEDDGGDHAED